jgi:hypothetical protein
MIERRQVIAAGIALLAAAPAWAKDKFGFKEAALAMSAVAQGLAAYVAALRDANARGQARLSQDQATAAAADLLDLYASLSELAMVQRTRTLKEMEKYGEGPLPSDWPEIQMRIGATVDAIEKVNSKFDQQINGFILSDLYPAFKGSFAERAALLRRIRELPAPKSKKEVGDFRRLVANYRSMLDQVDALRAELQLMIKVTGAPGGMVGTPSPTP